MSIEPPDLLEEAMSVLTVIGFAQKVGLHGLKVGINKSPFRSEGNPSFSIFDGGRAWKDHGTGEGGGVWAFAQRVHPNATKGELARMIKEAAGIVGDGEVRSAPVVAPPPPEEFRHTEAWSLAVKDRFEHGLKDLAAARAVMEKIADRRGWPVSFMERLLEAELISYPPLPWCEPDKDLSSAVRFARGIAFKVEGLQVDGDVLTTRPVGYHQRFRIDDKPSWIYVPYLPRQARSGFQDILAEQARKVHPYPFTFGDPRARGWVLTEGQWDAATFGLAAGKSFRGRVFGLRGSHTCELFLRCVGGILRETRPTIWMIPDNDEAGRKWYERSPEKPDVPTFAEQLQAAGAGRVVVSTVRPDCGKDFNDLFRARWITSEDIKTWAAALGVHDWFFTGPVALPSSAALASPAPAAAPAGVGGAS